MRYLIIPLLILFSPICWSEEAIAEKICQNKYGAKLDSLQGKVFFDANGKGQWQQAQLHDLLCEGSRVRVEPYSRASLTLPNGIILRLDANTVLSLNGMAPNETTLLDLLKGFVHFISRTPKHLEITSPIANAGPEGTEFAMRVEDKNASLWVYEGGVRFFNAHGTLSLKPGQSAEALAGQAPKARIDIKPEDAVYWALYYPPLIPYPETSENIDAGIRNAIQDFRQGRIDDALIRLDAFAPEKQSPYFNKVRGAMRLTIGQIPLAKQDIQAILEKNPNDAEALALQSVLALTQNHKQEAYDLAKRAVVSDAHSASAYSALSYAEQGRFELDKALEAAEQAVKNAPHDAMALARKAELELAKGLTKESQSTAKQALELDANLERTQTVLGFAYLQSMETNEALQAFENAIKLDSSSPLARQGLGLAKIRKGYLAEGRKDLEIAAILDPNNSLIRSYLGKAYFEEKRNPLAQDQFDLAKERDAKDPTPWFYNAIKKQTENRPVEALQDLQTAIALNDNRAVYRSKQLLDNDMAIRNTSLARIYDDLGFDSRATVEATKSLTIDPSNYSAHRFLSDAYVRLPRREIAQVSELLQSQLLQPLNMNPIQPHLSVKGLNAISGTGPAEPSFKDFTNAYQRNDDQFFISGFVGNHRTKGEEAVLSGIHDNISYSLGQYHYDTEGWRKDANVTHNVYDAFLQAAITPDVNVQLELRKRQTEQGDLRLKLDGNFVPNEKRKLNQNTGRLGINISLYPESLLLGSFIYNNRKENVNTESEDDLSKSSQQKADVNKSYGAEIQFRHTDELFNTILGGGTYKVAKDSTTKNRLEIKATEICEENPFPGFFCIPFPEAIQDSPPDRVAEKIWVNTFYIYNTINLPSDFHWTMGLSYEAYEQTPEGKPTNSRQRVNPKLGVQWFATDWLRLRAAYIGTVKRELIADQTIEPTQVAGFNQFYDDSNGRRSILKGVGLDAKFRNNVFAGIEFTDRTIRGSVNLADREDSVRGYLNWSPLPNWSFGLEGQFERFDLTGNGVLLPYLLETTEIPVTIRYFDLSGFFAQLSPRFIWQSKLQNKQEIKTNFTVVDLSIGYRLPKKRGIVSLEIQNLADEKTFYQDAYDRTSDKFNVNNSFSSSRSILFKTVLNF
ncbi:MAG: TonB-dependent receptor [Methylophilaceae bacterium]|nr:TonB-dependent receptor [Methylophilaceae bacterium]